MRVKRWTFSGYTQCGKIHVGESTEIDLLEESSCKRMLGVVSSADKPSLMKKKTKKPRLGPDLSKGELQRNPQEASYVDNIIRTFSHCFT